MVANRIVVHLLPEEQEALSRMVETDVRPPAIQLRYLLVEESRRRGLLPKMNDCAGTVSQATTGAIVTANP